MQPHPRVTFGERAGSPVRVTFDAASGLYRYASCGFELARRQTDDKRFALLVVRDYVEQLASLHRTFESAQRAALAWVDLLAHRRLDGPAETFADVGYIVPAAVACRGVNATSTDVDGDTAAASRLARAIRRTRHFAIAGFAFGDLEYTDDGFVWVVRDPGGARVMESSDAMTVGRWAVARFGRGMVAGRSRSALHHRHNTSSQSSSRPSHTAVASGGQPRSMCSEPDS